MRIQIGSNGWLRNVHWIREAHLGVGKVLALVADVVGLEPKEEVQLVQEVHSQLPLQGTAEGRVAGDGGVEGDDVGLRW